MPASTADPIASTLKRSFGHTSKLLEDGLETGLSKRSLVPVPFDPPCRISSPGPLKHYIILNTVTNGINGVNGVHSLHKGEESNNPVAIPRPKITFFKQEDVKVGYGGPISPGAGMMNVGNTCYLNSTLQALFHTPSLVNYLTDGHHRCVNNNGGYSLHACTICALWLTLKDTHRSHIVRPSRVYEKLKTICKHLVHGRQEDAHEFLRYLIESLQKSFLISVKAKNLDNASKETTPFNQIFGGYMRQDVTCVRCKYVSTTFQHFMDLLLDIRSASNIEEALAHYFRPEKLGGMDGSNMYKCEKCKVKVPAQKASFIERPPVVLCIQLKRFALTGGKISKSVQLSRRLEISRFVRGAGGRDVKLEYRLVSMITHVGPSPNCGHYTAIGEASNGQFYQFDDSHVRPVPVSQALNTASYVVMYEMTQASHNAWTRSSLQSTSPSSSVSINAKLKNDQKTSSVTPHPAPVVISNNSLAQMGGNNNSNKNNSQNGLHKPATTSLLLPKKLVPYDELDSSSNEDDEKTDGSQLKKKKEDSVLNGSEAISQSSSSAVVNGESSQCSSNNGVGSSKRPHPSSSSGFLPVSIALKQQQIPHDEKRPSASGTWTVVDMEHHNPSIHSDNSSSSGSQWKIHTVQQGANKRPDSDSEMSRSSSWSVKQTNNNPTTSTNSDSEVGSPKKIKKMNVVKEAISNTLGRLFTNKNKPPVHSAATVNGDEGGGGKSSNSDSKETLLNGHSDAHRSSSTEKEDNNNDHDRESLDEKRKKKRKKSFSNGVDESPSKKYINSSDSRWSSSNGHGNVVDELLRQSSSLSDKVTAWNGGKSSTFSSSSFNYNRSRSDSRDRYDDELDRGRTKKIKRRHSDTTPYHSNNTNGVNPFQMAQQNGYHQSSSSNGHHHHHRNSSFKDYNGRHSRRPFYHHRNNLRNSHGGSFDEGKFRKGYRSNNNNDYYHRSRR